MELNDIQTRIINVYKSLFQYRHLLKGAPVLSVDLANMSDSQIAENFVPLESELSAVIHYLMGLRGASFPVSVMLEAVNKHYKKDDFWRSLLLDYVEIKQLQAEAEVQAEKHAMQEEGIGLYEKLKEFQKRRKEIVDSFSEKIAPQKFPVDAKRLFKNYLNMADLDSEEAWRVLCTNPAFFSPLIVEDEKGKRLFSIKEAKEVNKKMADFLRKMKA